MTSHFFVFSSFLGGWLAEKKYLNAKVQAWVLSKVVLVQKFPALKVSYHCPAPTRDRNGPIKSSTQFNWVGSAVHSRRRGTAFLKQPFCRGVIAFCRGAIGFYRGAVGFCRGRVAQHEKQPKCNL